MVLTVFYVKPVFDHTDEEITPRQIVKDHWAYGIWSSLTRILTWLSSNFGYLIIPLLIGLSGTAALRAILNLTMPLFMINSALISLLVPNFVRTYERQGKPALSRRILLIAGIATGLTSFYALLVVLFGKPLISLIYDGKYDDVTTTTFLLAVALLPIIVTNTQMFIAALRAMGQVKLTFMSRIIPTILMVILDILLVSAFGIIGVPIESLITAALSLGIVYWFYRREQPPAQEESDTVKSE